MNKLPKSFYKAQYEKLLNHNQELQGLVDYWKKRVGGRKPADRLKYKRMSRFGIKWAIKLVGKFGVCWFYSSKSTDKKVAERLSKLFNK